MPKRSCPFGEVAPVQLKTRVGLRELSRGVRGEEYRRQIFERTRQLLFKGAQAYMESSGAADPAARPPEPAAEPQDGRWSGQMLIGRDGKLLRRPPGPHTGSVPAGAEPRACWRCVRAAAAASCGLCERPVCPGCSRPCPACGTRACSLCQPDSGDVGEQVLCSGCSIFQV
ncbi:SIVA protein, partial [Turnix velox]|nr:SIVA protein [Turnix velox]